MAAKVSNSINEQMFYALKVSENSGVPVLFMSNPGVGKSTTVEMFAQIRGYHLLTLRGNSTTNEEVVGYDTVPEGIREGQRRAACSLRPSWFQELLDIDAQGGKTLLFLDEITTAHSSVQSALFQLVLERRCKNEKLPNSTLIVAAGNYQQNLDASMALLAPTMNRFMIFNLVPQSKDLDMFLNRYSGASVNPDHMPDDKMGNLRKLLEDMDKQEITLDKSVYYRIGEFIENSVKITAKMLLDHKKEIDWGVNDLNNIYSDPVSDTDQDLYGFTTLRTLGYIVEWAFSSYKCFGAPGLTTDNLFKAIKGLVGIGLSLKDGTVNINLIGMEFFNALKHCIQDIERLNNSSISEYEEFFSDILKKKEKKGFEKEDLVAFTSKLKDLMNDKTLKGIERPFSDANVEVLVKVIGKTVDKLYNQFKGVKLTTAESANEELPAENFAGRIETWNLITDLCNHVTKLICDKTMGYHATEKDLLTKCVDSLSKEKFSRIRAIKRSYMNLLPGAVLPDIHELKTVF